MSNYTRITKLVSIRFVILTVLAMLVVIALPGQGPVNVSPAFEPPQTPQTLSEIGALTTVERSIVGTDVTTGVSFELPVKFGFSDESDGAIANALSVENLVVLNSGSIEDLTKIGCTLKIYTFLYINDIAEFDTWESDSPEILSGIAAEFSSTDSFSGTDGLVSAGEVNDITNAGYILVFENLTATFGTGSDAVSVRCGPESITMGVNFSLSAGAVAGYVNIDDLVGSEPISYDGDDVLIEFGQSLPTQTASQGLTLDPITITLIAGLGIAVVIAILVIMKKR